MSNPITGDELRRCDERRMFNDQTGAIATLYRHLQMALHLCDHIKKSEGRIPDFALDWHAEYSGEAKRKALRQVALAKLNAEEILALGVTTE